MVPKTLQEIKGLGEFPSDWAIQSADDLTSKITKGTTPPKSEITDDPIIPFLRVNNLSFNGDLNDSSDMIYVSKDAHTKFLARSIAYPGDILMNIVGPPLGKVSMLNQDFDEYNMNQAIVVYRTESDKVDNNYFLHYLLSLPAQNWLQSRSKKTSGQQNLTIEICKSLPVPIPPLSEQQKIAKILSTWDKAISTTERLIDNSTQQKKALMQQLLMGKKRLLNESGQRFEGEWARQPISFVADVITGNTPSTKNQEYYGGGKLFVSPSDLGISKYILETTKRLTDLGFSQTRKVPKGSSLFTCIGSTIGKLGIAGEELATNQQINSVCAKGNNCGEFIYYQLLFHAEQIKGSAATQAVPIINKTNFESQLIFSPASLEEQQKIATVLTNADREIELLKQQLADLQQEKKALMQVLLTGKKRVVV